jgi:hypothetical protein
MPWSPDMLEGLPPIDRWRIEIGRHLDLIAVGASICTRHARQLPVQPAHDTKAEDGLRRAEIALQAALADVRAALATFRAKEIER